MPQFFNPKDLTPEQQARWQGAMEEYRRVQEANLDREIAAMSEAEQAKNLAYFKKNRQKPYPELTLKEHMQTLSVIMGGGAGDSKSALFARLLDGKPALPFPPPTAMSYPWYDVVEGKGPFNVMIGGAQTMGSAMRGTRGVKGLFGIGINQCTWAVLAGNKPAKKLMTLQKKLDKTAKPEKAGSLFNKVEWTDEFYREVADAYAAQPEFMVKHGEYPAYRLRIGRGVSRSQRQYAEDSLSRLPPDGLSNSSVFDTHHLLLNGVICDTISKGEHPRKRLNDAKKRQGAFDEAGTGGNLGLAQLFIEQKTASLVQDAIAYEARPDGQDFVEFSFDDWVLEKTNQTE